MKIELSTKVIQSTELGLEDLSLQVLVSVPAAEVPENELESTWRSGLDDAWETFEVVKADYLDLRLEGDTLVSDETETGFSVNTPRDVLKEQIRENLVRASTKPDRTVRWVKDLRSNVYECEFEIFVDGNAD